MKTINFTSIHHDEIEKKLNIFKVLNYNFEKLDIKDYSDKIDELLIVFQAIKPDSPLKVEAFKKMRRKTKTLELYLVLDYNFIMQGTEAENLQNIKEVFVKGCETFLKPLKGFLFNEFLVNIKGMR